MKKNILILLLISLNVFSYGQTNKQTAGTDKICIDTLNTKLLFGKWYDFSPNFFVEQANYIIYYVKKPTDLSDSTNYKGTFIFNKDGSFEKTFKINDTTFKSIKGTWTIPSGTRHIKLTISDNKYPQTWTVLELNRDIFILKYGT